MRVFSSEMEYDLGPTVAALGTFDGIHIGHQALIARAMALARELRSVSVVCTFDRHPLSVLCPQRAPVPLMTAEEKLEKLEAMGVDAVILKPFTAEFAAMEPRSYLQMLARQLHLRAVVAGFNYSFGAGGRGDAALIRALARELNYRAEIVNAVKDGEETVSSTLIRALLARGDADRANRLMALQVKV